MRCYTIEKGGRIIEGIFITEKGIALGQTGWGREVRIIPLSEGAEISEGKVISVPSRTAPPGAVLLVIRDQSGFEGSWSIITASYWTEITRGWCAQGEGGRMGGGPEYLGILAPYGVIEIRRTGQLYGDPPVLRVANTPAGIEVRNPSAVESDCQRGDSQ